MAADVFEFMGGIVQKMSRYFMLKLDKSCQCNIYGFELSSPNSSNKANPANKKSTMAIGVIKKR